jgi:hypothetical protein
MLTLVFLAADFGIVYGGLPLSCFDCRLAHSTWALLYDLVTEREIKGSIYIPITYIINGNIHGRRIACSPNSARPRLSALTLGIFAYR